MTARTKSILLLLGTLLIGMLLGVFIHSRMVEDRIERLTSLRSQAGFVQFVDKMIEPTDDAQREAIRTVLEDAAAALDVHHAENRVALEEIMGSFRASLDSLLTEEQLQALNERMERAWKYRKGSRSRHSDRRDTSRKHRKSKEGHAGQGHAEQGHAEEEHVEQGDAEQEHVEQGDAE